MTDRKAEEAQLHTEINEATQARRIIEDPLWIETWDGLDARWMAIWNETLDDDTEGRELVWKMRRIAQEVRQQFETMVETGTMAEIGLERLRQEKARNG